MSPLVAYRRGGPRLRLVGCVPALLRSVATAAAAAAGWCENEWSAPGKNTNERLNVLSLRASAATRQVGLVRRRIWEDEKT